MKKYKKKTPVSVKKCMLPIGIELFTRGDRHVRIMSVIMEKIVMHGK